MDTPTTFLPASSGQEPIFYIALILSIAGLVGCVWQLRKTGTRENYTRRMLVAMLLFFVFLIGASTAFFSGLSTWQAGPVHLYSDRIEINQGTIPFSEIKRASIVKDQEPYLLGGAGNKRTTHLLFVERTNGKTYVFSEEHYEVKRMLEVLKAALKPSR